MEVQVDGDTVRDKDAVVDILETLLFQDGQLGEESGDVEDDAGADQVYLAVLGDQPAGEEVEAVVVVGLVSTWRARCAVGGETYSYETPLALRVGQRWRLRLEEQCNAHDRVAGIVALGFPSVSWQTVSRGRWTYTGSSGHDFGTRGVLEWACQHV